jgi:nucleoside-diphosphate-sugar epimerase
VGDWKGVIRRFVQGKITFCPRPDDLVSNYVFIDDLVRGHLQAIEKGKSGEKYILAAKISRMPIFFE